MADENKEAIEKLQAAFADHPELCARQLEPSEIPKLQELDALYLTLPAAERWNPQLLFYESQVLKTRPEDKDWPRHIVTGIAMDPNDPRASNREAELELVIKAVLNAVESYNKESSSPIKTVGFWTRDLRINRMDASAAGEIIKSVYEEHFHRR
jgi:hypothetical protein